MSRSSVNILLTSVGRRVELVQAFRQAYRELNIGGNIIGSDINPLAPALQIVDKPYIVPPNASDDYIDALLTICLKEEINLIFPLIDPDIPRLSQARELLEGTAAKLVVVTERAVEIASDKWRTYQFFSDLGIPTPRTWLPGQVPHGVTFPLFIKPRFGSASQDTFKIRNKSELDFFSGYVQNPIIQEYLPGSEVTNDILCNLDGNVLSVVSRQRLEVRGGEVVKGVTMYDATITSHCVTIAQQLPAIGPVTIQCITKDAMPFFTEINARFGGGVPLSIAAGVNGPKILLALFAGVEIEIPSVGEFKTGLFVSRFDSGFFIDESQRDDLAKRRV